METEIVRRAKGGDSRALEEIYNETRQMVYFTALGILRNEEDAEDVVQDTYIKVFQNIAHLRDENAFISWLKMIAVNVSKNSLKKHKPLLFQNDEQENAMLGSVEEIGEDFLPQEYVDQAEKREIIKNMVKDLPDTQRTAVMLYYFDELPLSEVAKVMETTDGTTKSRLNYARKQIRAGVEDQEKKGNKLYAGVPMLTRILHLVSRNYDLPAKAVKHILADSLQAANAAPESEAAIADRASAALKKAASVKTAEGATASGSATSAAKGIIAKIAGMSFRTKVIALIVAGAIVAGSGTGAALAVKNRNDAVQAAAVLQQKQEAEREAKAESEAKAKAESEAAAKEKAAKEKAAEETAARAKAASAAAKKKAAEEAAAKAKAASAAAKKKAEQAKKQNKALYKAFYDAHWKNKAKVLFFADLTHDGSDEMMIGWIDSSTNQFLPYYVLDIYTVRGGAVTKICTRGGDGTHAAHDVLYLYRENGRDYLFTYTGWGVNLADSTMTTIGYSLLFMNANGDTKEWKHDVYEQTTSDTDGTVKYSQPGTPAQQKKHENAVRQAIKDYRARSKFLLNAGELEEYGIHEDLSFGESDPNPFGEEAAGSAVSRE